MGECGQFSYGYFCNVVRRTIRRSRGESGARTCPCPARRLRSALRRERPLRPRVPTPHSSGRSRGPTPRTAHTPLHLHFLGARLRGVLVLRPTLPQPSGGVRWRLLFVCVGLSLCLSVSLCMQPVEYLFRYFEEAAAPPAPSRLVSVAIRAPAGLVAVADRRCARGVRPLYYFTVFQFSQFHHSSPVRCGYPVWQVRTLHIALYLPCAFPCRGGARDGMRHVAWAGAP